MSRWKLLADFQARLGEVCREAGGVGTRFADQRRKLDLESYLSLFLFGLLNPVIHTMRGLCEGSGLKRVQEEVCRRPEQLSAGVVSQLYRRRWQVELFFRWVKCILGNRHWLAQSQRGVSLQIYLALIAGLLLQLHSGVLPNKRMMERIRLYLMGMANLEELEEGIAKELARMEKRAMEKS